MRGFCLFVMYLNEVSEEVRNLILGNILGISDVKVSNVSIDLSLFKIRVFDGVVVYNYYFCLEMGEDYVIDLGRIVNNYVFIDKTGRKRSSYEFINRLILCLEMNEVEELVREYLL